MSFYKYCTGATASKALYGALIMAAFLATAVAAQEYRGLPLVRSYPIEDIGPVSRGANLSFDSFGRLAVVQEGVYEALNDTVWVSLADDESRERPAMVNAVLGRDGRLYYGGRGDWGVASIGANGKIALQSLAPAVPENWVKTALFVDVIPNSRGVAFESWNGIVYVDYETGESRLHDLSIVSKVFALRDAIYVSSVDEPLKVLSSDGRRLEQAFDESDGIPVVEHAAAMGDGRALISDLENKLWEFDGTRFAPWAPQARYGLTGGIGCIQSLVEGGVAIAVVGQGLFLVDPAGELRLSLTLSDYHRVTDLASSEPGVLWAATEDAIEKISYGSPLSAFGQRLGLTAAWPIVESWKGRLFVASEGELFEGSRAGPGSATRFERVSEQPPGGTWSIAANEDHMLVGSSDAVYTVADDGSLTNILPFHELIRLVMVGDGRCFVIGARQIALLERAGGRWVEACERISGLEYAPIAHASRASAWIELGGAGVARVWEKDGKLRKDVFENSDWADSRWTNVGILGDIVALSASGRSRRFFDESANGWSDAPVLRSLLDRSPRWIARAEMDSDGAIWATHNEGVIKFTPEGDGYSMDSRTYDQINDRYPIVTVLNGNDVWLTAGRSLYHVEKGTNTPMEPLRPTLVSVRDSRTGAELMGAFGQRRGETLSLPYARNSLSFLFFAGGYSWRRAPAYEYRLGENANWTPLDSGSKLSFGGLREGEYQLEARLADEREGPQPVARFAFEILPPWYRTAAAYVSYATLLIAAVLIGWRWSNHIVRRRNRLLECTVSERTRELQAATERLNEEARAAATLAERNRMAGEIHDSLQQGLSGAMFQLDSTLTLPLATGEIRNRLHVIRSMVSYTRQEVQHLVWDMESPLLEGAELSEALKRLARYIDTQVATIRVAVQGEPIHLPNAVSHNLLRIAQEATANAVKHAHASRIDIRLSYGPSEVELEVSDDGVGFVPSEFLSSKRGNFGLRGMRSRAKRLAGALDIESGPGEGTAIRARVPIEQQAPAPTNA